MQISTLIAIGIFGIGLLAKLNDDKRKRKSQSDKRSATIRPHQQTIIPPERNFIYSAPTIEYIEPQAPQQTEAPVANLQQNEEGQRVTQDFEMSSPTPIQTDENTAAIEELRKAIIWSEILKRKF